jgi:hypothetical protein
MEPLGHPGFYFVKISNDVYSIDQLVGGKYQIFGYGTKDIYSYDFDTVTYPGAITLNNEIIIVHTEDELNAALGLPDGYLTNGVYFVLGTDNEVYVEYLVSKPDIIKIDGKFIKELSDGLHAIATSGSWYDLIDKPGIVSYTESQGIPSSNQRIARNNIDVYSKSEVDNKIANAAPSVNLNAYAKTTEVETMINTAIGTAIGGSY